MYLFSAVAKASRILNEKMNLNIVWGKVSIGYRSVKYT